MKLIVLFSMIATVFGQIDHGCKVNCDCPDFTQLFTVEGLVELNYTKLDGCNFFANCLNGKDGEVRSEWTKSEIEKPEDVDVTFFEFDMDENEEFMTTLGIVCEDGKWLATKYPWGIYYTNSGDGGIRTGFDGVNDGKKSQIDVGTW
ncbi:hypothetical protein CAEBREN_04802 [Caenorhabditis brenneri]|uniref:Uncharacterized protein n=1 Tax=Caenorhabditis brenneri TaxID=135651 RepID=G0NGF7_CAEBE|nr:hypothetical protein CAEBREN_04802 [Caenorhabditis brenneri]